MNMELTIHNIIWSKGPIRNDYSKKDTECSSSRKEIKKMMRSVTKENNVVCIRNGNAVNDLEVFAKYIYLLKVPILLLTTDGDRSMPLTHEYTLVHTILRSNMILKWYTQNYDKRLIHPKLTHFPIGMDLHTNRWLVKNSISEKIKCMVAKRRASPTDMRISNKILCDAHNTISHPERLQLYTLLKNAPNIEFVNGILPFDEITELYNKYNFVLSPRGNGLDCHRTWELFLAGAIVITKTSSLDDMYTNHNLPVVIVQDWNELQDNLECKLQEWYTTYIDRTSIDNIFTRLTFEYWLHK